MGGGGEWCGCTLCRVQGQRQKNEYSKLKKVNVFCFTSATFKLSPVAGNTISNWDSCKVHNIFNIHGSVHHSIFWGGHCDYLPHMPKKT
jgi:hypothetical protein